jgi:hypothetical protein
MNVYGEITGVITSSGTITGTLSSPETLVGSLTIPSAILPPIYEGATDITPSSEAQALDTALFYMLEDITINAIPNNYGLIEWNGSILTVS